MDYSPLMPISLTTLLATLSTIFCSRASPLLENLALRHQIGVLQRSRRKRPKLTSGDRLLWICQSRPWGGWHSALAIVKPETVVTWHRAAFRLSWTWKVRRGQPGRPLIPREVRDLIRKMCQVKPGWGAPRTHGDPTNHGSCACERQGRQPQLDLQRFAVQATLSANPTA